MSVFASVALCEGQCEAATHAMPQTTIDLLLGAAPFDLVARLDEEALQRTLALRWAVFD